MVTGKSRLTKKVGVVPGHRTPEGLAASHPVPAAEGACAFVRMFHPRPRKEDSADTPQRRFCHCGDHAPAWLELSGESIAHSSRRTAIYICAACLCFLLQ